MLAKIQTRRVCQYGEEALEYMGECTPSCHMSTLPCAYLGMPA